MADAIPISRLSKRWQPRSRSTDGTANGLDPF